MRDQTPIGIIAWGSSSALGGEAEEIWQGYTSFHTVLQKSSALDNNWAGIITEKEEEVIRQWRLQHKNYRRLDRSVLLAMLAAQRAWEASNWSGQTDIGLYLGSSRGATGSWETYFEAFRTGSHQLPPQASPLSTTGNISTHTAQHLELSGFSTDNSITCSSALHAIANAIAWLESGRYEYFLAGGAEAPLTSFTLAQMQALKIYAAPKLKGPYPNRSLQLDKEKNGMILGEGAAVFALARAPKAPLAWISGLGYARENIYSLTSVSKTGIALQTAMRQALKEAKLNTVDVIVCHSPGTRLGDLSEYAAIRTVFGENIPSLTSNKWKIGHTLGASGGLSLEMALLMLEQQTFLPIPYLAQRQPAPKIRRIMVNAMGFGGNAISIIIEQP